MRSQCGQAHGAQCRAAPGRTRTRLRAGVQTWPTSERDATGQDVESNRQRSLSPMGRHLSGLYHVVRHELGVPGGRRGPAPRRGGGRGRGRRGAPVRLPRARQGASRAPGSELADRAHTAHISRPRVKRSTAERKRTLHIEEDVPETPPPQLASHPGDEEPGRSTMRARIFASRLVESGCAFQGLTADEPGSRRTQEQSMTRMIRCPACGTTNRVPLGPRSKRGRTPVCGRCKTPLRDRQAGDRHRRHVRRRG